MQKPPLAAKSTHFLLLFAFAMLPILLMAVVVPGEVKPLGPQGSAIFPMAVSGLAGSMALFFLISKLGSDQELEKFQTNMLITMASAELITLMGVFIAAPRGLSPLPFFAANYLILAAVLLRVVNFWVPRR